MSGGILMNFKQHSRSSAFLLVVLALSTLSLNAFTSRPTTDYSQYVGKYPSEMFKKEPGLKTKLRTLLGTSYKAFFDRMQVETPIEKDGEAIVMRGCMAHQCTVE